MDAGKPSPQQRIERMERELDHLYDSCMWKSDEDRQEIAELEMAIARLECGDDE